MKTRTLNALKKHLSKNWTDEEIHYYYAQMQKYNLRNLAQVADWMRTFRAWDNTQNAVIGGYETMKANKV